MIVFEKYNRTCSVESRTVKITTSTVLSGRSKRSDAAVPEFGAETWCDWFMAGY